jgi:hypothetical protein
VLQTLETAIQRGILIRKGITFEQHVEIAALQKELEKTLEELNPTIKSVTKKIAEIESGLDKQRNEARDARNKADRESALFQSRSSKDRAFRDSYQEFFSEKRRERTLNIPYLTQQQAPDDCGTNFNLTMTLVEAQASGFAIDHSAERVTIHGLVGWADFAGIPLGLFNGGASGGRIMRAQLTLAWRATIPHEGAYIVRRISPFVRVRGDHTVHGEGWYYSGIDARVEIDVSSFLYLTGGNVIGGGALVSFGDATKSEDRTKEFSRDLSLPDGICFKATQGQELTYFLYLNVETFANDDGSAYVNITDFWAPAINQDQVIMLRD